MIKPVYDHAGITIYCADIFDVLPQIVDAGVSFVWADPPYGISSVQASGALQGRGRTSAPQGLAVLGQAERLRESSPPTVPVGGAKAFGKTSHGAADRFGRAVGKVAGGTAGHTKMIAANVYPVVIGDETTETAEKAFCALTGAFPKARHVWWGANHYGDVIPASSAWCVWDKENTANFADAELAWTNHPGAVRICRHKWNGLLKASERAEKRFHPNQKPVYLAAWCFDRFGKPGDVILEPFMGSGPGLRAAKRMNRCAIGVELSMDYCEQVIERLEQGGLDFGDEELSAPPAAAAPTPRGLFEEDGGDGRETA
ncbi:MAG TPA: DNA methyltransferase [Bryobacteraceae bacterium]|nr:DNA methyltransferase [Bryobacteraceae bacterium]